MEDGKSNPNRPKLFIPKAIINVHYKELASQPDGRSPLSGPFPLFDRSSRSSVTISAIPSLDLLPATAIGQDALSTMAQQQHISFTRLCLTAAQLVYKQLEDMMDVLPKMNNIERKQHIISMALKGRELFYKLAIISDFMAARSKDVYLANLGMMALKNYNDALVKVADSLVFSIDQALLKTTAPIQITDAIDMIATGEIHHLPSILSSEFTALPELDTRARTKWANRLGNLLKVSAMKTFMSLPVRIDSVKNGVVSVAFFNDVFVHITLVPLFEDKNMAWYFLSANFDENQRLSNLLTAHLQTNYNNVRMDESSAIFQEISSDIALLRFVYALNSIRTQFEDLKRDKLGDMEIIIKDANGFSVKFWPSTLERNAPQISFQISATKQFSVECSWDSSMASPQVSLKVDPVYAESIINQMLRAHCTNLLNDLRQRLRALAVDVLPLYEPIQIDIVDLTLTIQMPNPQAPMVIGVSAYDGQCRIWRAGPSSAASLVALEEQLRRKNYANFVKTIQQLRSEELLILFKNGIKSHPDLLLIDSSPFQLGQFSSSIFIFALGKLQDKYVLVDLNNGAKVPTLHSLADFGGSSYSRTVSCQLQCSFNESDVAALRTFDLGPILDRLNQSIPAVVKEGLRQDLIANNILFEELSMTDHWAHFDLRNIGRPAQVESIQLVCTNVGQVSSLIQLKFPLRIGDAVATETTLIRITTDSRFRFSDGLSKVQGFLALLIISEQLNRHHVRYTIIPDCLSLFHPAFPLVQLAYTPNLPPEILPLSLILDNKTASAAEKEILQASLRRSANISPLIDFLDRKSRSVNK